MFSAEVEDAARRHAVKSWDHECCGIVEAGAYVPLMNVAEDPRATFRLPVRTFADHAVEAVIHSHCSERNRPWPSRADMVSQLETGVPWGIVWTSATEARGPIWWGEFVLDEPLIGRDFHPGIHDCYSLLRAWFWQTRGIKLLEFPRDENWWDEGADLFREGFAKAGFFELKGDDSGLREGDVVLMQIHGKVPNHCGIILDNGLMLHHLAGRLSRHEPFGPWARFVTHRLRYEG